jgi:hypothetical protein
MFALTILDYTSIDREQKNIRDSLQVKDKQIQQLTKQMAAMEEDHRSIMEILQDGGALLKKKLDEEDNLVS